MEGSFHTPDLMPSSDVTQPVPPPLYGWGGVLLYHTSVHQELVRSIQSTHQTQTQSCDVAVLVGGVPFATGYGPAGIILAKVERRLAEARGISLP